MQMNFKSLNYSYPSANRTQLGESFIVSWTKVWTVQLWIKYDYPDVWCLAFSTLGQKCWRPFFP